MHGFKKERKMRGNTAWSQRLTPAPSWISLMLIWPLLRRWCEPLLSQFSTYDLSPCYAQTTVVLEWIKGHCVAHHVLPILWIIKGSAPLVTPSHVCKWFKSIFLFTKSLYTDYLLPHPTGTVYIYSARAYHIIWIYLVVYFHFGV